MYLYGGQEACLSMVFVVFMDRCAIYEGILYLCSVNLNTTFLCEFLFFVCPVCMCVSAWEYDIHCGEKWGEHCAVVFSPVLTLWWIWYTNYLVHAPLAYAGFFKGGCFREQIPWCRAQPEKVAERGEGTPTHFFFPYNFLRHLHYWVGVPSVRPPGWQAKKKIDIAKGGGGFEPQTPPAYAPDMHWSWGGGGGGLIIKVLIKSEVTRLLGFILPSPSHFLKVVPQFMFYLFLTPECSPGKNTHFGLNSKGQGNLDESYCNNEWHTCISKYCHLRKTII